MNNKVSCISGNIWEYGLSQTAGLLVSLPHPLPGECASHRSLHFPQCLWDHPARGLHWTEPCSWTCWWSNSFLLSNFPLVFEKHFSPTPSPSENVSYTTKQFRWGPLSSSLIHSLLFFNLDIQVQPKASLSSSKPCLSLSWGRGSITALAREKRTLALRFRTLSRSLRVSELKALFFYTAEPNALLSRCACEQNKMRKHLEKTVNVLYVSGC